MKREIKRIEIGASIFEENDRIAEENRQLLKEHQIFALNIMGAPGSGKTTILEKTVEELGKTFSFAVIEGDIKGILDSERLARFGIPVVQINTGGACHLDANMVAQGLKEIPLANTDILFVENVGNLVCPAEFDIGTQVNIIISSIPEGEEKPLKYPLMFMISEICLLNKADIAKYDDFDFDLFARYLKTTAPKTRTITLSAKSGEGMKEWLDYLTSTCIRKDSAINRLILKGRVVIMGIGNRMKGDDGVGPLIAERLKKSEEDEDIKIINAENVPENYLDILTRFKPDTVVIIDAVDFKGRPGDTRIFTPKNLIDTTSSTHTFSLPLIIQHIESETGAECIVIGIQPANTTFTERVSTDIFKAAERTAKKIHSLLKKK